MSSSACSYVTQNVSPLPFSATQQLGFPVRTSVTFPTTYSPNIRLLKHQRSPSSPKSTTRDEDSAESSVQSLKIPDEWLLPSKAIEESEWLRVTLHKWLDDEYCPEPTNVEISQVAAKSYYASLLEKETDMGEILLKMAQDLSSISYKESFHGAYTSANAAISLIVDRLETDLV